MNTTIPRKKDIAPSKPIYADDILANMIKSRNFKVANERLRKEIITKQKLNNLINSRDRLLSYVDSSTIPALKLRLKSDLYKINTKMDENLFNLHVLGKTNKLI